MAEWQRQTLKLQKNHGWKAKPGNQIFVADRGALRFDFPQGWIVKPGEEAIVFHDRQPPDDNIRLQVTLMRIAPEIDLAAIPFAEICEAVFHDTAGDLRPRGATVNASRPGAEMAWSESYLFDPVEQRESRSRTLIARGPQMVPIITLDYWPEDATWLEPIWAELLRTLRMGEYIRDPTRVIDI